VKIAGELRMYEVKTVDNKIIISIDRSLLSSEVLFEFLERLRLEQLAEDVDFEEGILEIAEDIKSEWWEKIRTEF